MAGGDDSAIALTRAPVTCKHAWFLQTTHNRTNGHNSAVYHAQHDAEMAPLKARSVGLMTGMAIAISVHAGELGSAKQQFEEI